MVAINVVNDVQRISSDFCVIILSLCKHTTTIIMYDSLSRAWTPWSLLLFSTAIFRLLLKRLKKSSVDTSSILGAEGKAILIGQKVLSYISFTITDAKSTVREVNQLSDLIYDLRTQKMCSRKGSCLLDENPTRVRKLLLTVREQTFYLSDRKWLLRYHWRTEMP